MFVKNNLMTNLVSYFKLDESSGTINSSKGTITGTVTGADYSQTGKINTCMGFVRTSSDHIVLSSDTSYRFTSAFSVSAWIKTSSTVGTDNQFVIFGMYNAATSPADGWNLAISQDGKAYFSALDSSGTSYSRFSDAVIDDQEWHHVVAVWTGSVLQIYVDGIKSGSDVAMTNAPNYYTTHVPCIGCLNTYGSNYVHHFNGLIDEVGVWSRALDNKDVYDLYNSGEGLGYSFSDLKLWLPMTKGLGTTVYDYSGNEYNPTTYNSPAWYKAKDGKNVLNFNGSNNYLRTPSLEGLTSTRNLTILCWIYPTANGVVFAETSTNEIFHDAHIEVVSTSVVFATWSTNYATNRVSVSGLVLNAWNFVCMTYDYATTTLTGYVNFASGSKVYTRIHPNLDNSQVGYHYNIAKADTTNLGDGSYFDGRIKNILIFSRVLSVNEIKKLYEETYIE